MAAPHRELTVYAQPGEEGTWLYREKGKKTVLIDRKSPETAQVRVGSKVTGYVSQEDDRKVILVPTRIEPPEIIEVKAVLGRDGTRLGWGPDGRAVLFYTDAPKTSGIQVGDLVRGPVIRSEPNFVWLYPQEVTPGTRPVEAAPTGTYEVVHAFCPLVLNELVNCSRGLVRQEILGIRTPDQAFEDLVYAAFEFLGCGRVTQLGYRVGGQSAPDGDMFCPDREHAEYVVLWDAKSRAGAPGYFMGRDDRRAFEDYLGDEKYSQVDERALVVVSSSFADDPDELKSGTLTFLPSKVLGLICGWKAMNPTLVDLKTLKKVFFSGTIVTEEDVKEWAQRLWLREIRA